MFIPFLFFKQFYLLSNKNNRFLVKFLNDNNKLKIILENTTDISNDIYEYISVIGNIPGIYKFYEINDIIKKFSNDSNEFRLIEENESLVLIYKGKVDSENVTFKINKKNISFQEQIDKLYEIIKYQKKKIDSFFSFQSSILLDNDKNKVIEWINDGKNNFLYLKLVYRRGNNYQISNFHNKCDNIGPNLIICESKENEIFGGFTSISWGDIERIEYDKLAFIFSITKNVKYRNKSDSNSIRINKNTGPDFHWDFAFNCKNMLFCRSFLLKDKDKHGINIGKNWYLYDEPLFGDGYHNCEIKEIEVFQVMKYVIIPFN